ncbi:hypothetical protein [Pedobacter cryoconitis]|uniref:Carboxypeptidase-like protein n=1 Tax=Pedobacter cryoconitis TaxID=188932 RepID=A0A7X0MJY5_9SPHI|nr:hypothetical protein [Pedobacter cryoconitis]MBB6499938.1 hypothetical protein [Pedobacter cryoconitis]
MKVNYKQILPLFMLLTIFTGVRAQSQKMLNGVIFQVGTKTRVGGAAVYNKRTGYTNTTNNFGLFDILAQTGDTLTITHSGYQDKELIVSSFSNLVVYLRPSVNQLDEVKITSQSVKQGLKETEAGYRDKGIFYKGKPPLGLLSPIGGSPLTYLYERFSKDGKRARRLSELSAREVAYSDVSARFNNTVIKNIVPIKEKDLEDFKTAYWPDAEQLKKWADYDLHGYIKKSFEEFKKGKDY